MNGEFETNPHFGAKALTCTHGRSQRFKDYGVDFVECRLNGANAFALRTTSRHESQSVCAPAPALASSKRTLRGSGPNMDAMRSATGEAVRNCPSSSCLPWGSLQRGVSCLHATKQSFVSTSNRPASRSGVNAFRLALHQVEHGLDQPSRGKDLPVVGDAVFGLDQVHGLTHSKIEQHTFSRHRCGLTWNDFQPIIPEHCGYCNRSQ